MYILYLLFLSLQITSLILVVLFVHLCGLFFFSSILDSVLALEELLARIYHYLTEVVVFMLIILISLGPV